MVSSGQLPELVKRANDLDAEIKEGTVGWAKMLDLTWMSQEVRING